MLYVESKDLEVIVRVTHALDMQSVPELEALLKSETIRPFDSLTIDLRECRYIDSQAISAFIRFWRKHPDGFEVTVPATGAVFKVLDICGFISGKSFVRVDSDRPPEVA